MRLFFKLCMKEFKANKAYFLLLFFLTGLGLVCGLARENINIFRLTRPAKYLLAFSLPVLLLYAFVSEWLSGTHYQMLALPVQRYKVILAKIATVAIFGSVCGGIGIGIMYFWLICLCVLAL